MKVKVLLKCVYGNKKPGEEAEVEKEIAEHYAGIGWMEIVGVVEEQKPEPKEEPKKEEKAKKKTTKSTRTKKK